MRVFQIQHHEKCDAESSGFKQYFLDEAKKFPDDPVAKSVPSWEEVPTVEGTPQQNNGVDCGVFTCYFANYVSAEEKMDFSARDIPLLRRRLTLDILKKAVE
jgi:Ulp1 family protease